MIQEISPHVYTNRYFASRQVSPKDRVMMFREDCVLLKPAPELDIPTYAELANAIEGFGEQDLRFLFMIDDVGYYLSDFRAQA